jgi:hypothetical protein
MSEKKYQLMIDPTPRGWVYGFPRALPKEAVMGKGSDLWISNSFDLTEWVVSHGYPEESFQYYSVYPQEVHENCGTPECCGECETTTKQSSVESGERGVEYYTPGSDPQV